jgi:two-component system, OmpR family, phosphate regulon sensor histidine kinase PhoR
VTRQFAWLTVLLVGGTALAVLSIALVFVPIADWQTFVPLAVLVAAFGVIVAVVAVERAGSRLSRPLLRLARSIQEDRVGSLSLHEIASDTPGEVAPLLYGLHLTHMRLRTTLRQLEWDRAEVATILEHMTDSVLVLDEHERVVLHNPAAVRMLRYGAPLGRTVAEVTRDADLVELTRQARGDTAVTRVIELYADGSSPRRWIQASATCLPENRRLLVLQDVSELRRVEAARRDFVANVSHELRTPVAALKALVETLQAGALEDPVEGPAFLQRMHIEVDGLAQLVAELLELARVEAGRLDLQLAPCRADELVEEAVARGRPAAQQAELQLDLTVDEEPLWVHGDARRLGQVLSNLLANATKFTPPGGRIEAGARRADEGVELWVADNGVGIEREHLERVFERFFKTDPARASGSGTGLGLAIAKHLVLAHGGRIWAESPGPGRGATFRISLPAAQAPTETATPYARPIELASR